MSTLALCGLRGGVGNTSLVAALGCALQKQGQRVVVVDLCPESLLGLHFNLDAGTQAGWARADLDGGDWRSAAYEAMPGLAVLPYGHVSSVEAAEIERRLVAAPGTWLARRAALDRAYDWVVFDLPQRLSGHQAVGLGTDGCDLQLRVVNADPASIALFAKQPEAAWSKALALVNRYDPASRLQRDVMQVWLGLDGGRFVPPQVHEDQAVGEALASKRPIGVHAPHSLAAADIDSLAIWCLARAGEARKLAAP